MADIGTPVTSQPILMVEDSDGDFDATTRALNKSGNIKNPIHRLKEHWLKSWCCRDNRTAPAP